MVNSAWVVSTGALVSQVTGNDNGLVLLRILHFHHVLVIS
jgi:hypothetical protein